MLLRLALATYLATFTGAGLAAPALPLAALVTYLEVFPGTGLAAPNLSPSLSLAEAPAAQTCPLRIGQIQTKGIDKAFVRRIARSHRASLCACLERNPEQLDDAQQRKLVLRYLVSDSDKVVGVGRLQDAGAPAIARCMAKAVKRWSFPNTHTCGASIVVQTFWVGGS